MNTIPQQITYRHALAHQLGLTYLQYENLRYDFYIDWCIHLLACPPPPLGGWGGYTPTPPPATTP